jgi:hypothetical protein
VVAVLALVAVAALGASRLGGGKGEGDDDLAGGDRPAETTVAPPGGGNGDLASSTGGPTTAAAKAPACGSGSGRCAAIDAIRISGDHYVADYTVEGFDPITPDNGGGGGDHHVHLFFDTTSPEDAGTGSATPGRWTEWDRSDAGGALSFDEATVADAHDLGAHRLCILVADAHHGVEQGSGNCVDLPA